MKKAVVLHGTDGSPQDNWFPWLNTQLTAAGVETWVPLLPENHTPNRATYEVFLKNSGWNFADNLLIGHSSGATTALNLLQSNWFPTVDTVVLVGTFLNEKLTKNVDWYESGQFDNLFPETFDAEKIKTKAKKFYFLHGTNDPYCDIEDARDFCTTIDGTFIAVPDGLHLSSNRKELPEVIPILKDRKFL